MESLIGLTQRMVSTKVDLEDGFPLSSPDRYLAELSPSASTKTSPTGPEFVVAAMFKLGMPHQTLRLSNCELTHTPANQVQISFRNTDIEMHLRSSKI